MIEMLKDLKANYGVTGVKAEFEAEGTRMEELMRLKEIAMLSGVELTLKIGGCEAVRDIHDARHFGVQNLVAPMIESPFALQKYVNSIQSFFPKDEASRIRFLINIETIHAFKNFDEILESPSFDAIDGIVIGRGDLTESLGLDRTQVNSEEVFQITNSILKRTKEKGKSTMIGGGVGLDSLNFLRNLSTGTLDGFETRKVCFSCPKALNPEIAEEGIEGALKFELAWLSNKSNYYKTISLEDQKRIDALSKKLPKSNIVEIRRKIKVS